MWNLVQEVSGHWNDDMYQMPSNDHSRIETHRALELLTDFSKAFSGTEEKHLIIELERTIRILKSRFFQALIDIQEFYEDSLKDTASDWFVSVGDVSNRICSVGTETGDKQLIVPANDIVSVENHGDWEYEEITLKRSSNGLGFSIAGGDGDSKSSRPIHITRIVPDGAAALDGRLRINDIIERVDDRTFVEKTHAEAANILKRTGPTVKLFIRRIRDAEESIEFLMTRGEDGFGFSIAGGIDNHHITHDQGIYITKIVKGSAAEKNGHLGVGDKLVAVRSQKGLMSLANVTHGEAVRILKSVDDGAVFIVSKRRAMLRERQHPVMRNLKYQ